MSEPLKDYTGRCGGCAFYTGFIIKGQEVKRGTCSTAPTSYYMHNNRHGSKYRARHSQSRSASCKACRRYKEREAGLNGSDNTI